MILENIWFILWAVLWLVYFLLDGFDLGAAILLPFVAKGEKERGWIIKALGPVWNGNEVWLVTAGGATFAAFPKAYATLFSFFYGPLMLVLVALIIRGIAIEFRYHVESKLAISSMDTAVTLSSTVIALGLGALFANIFIGLPLSDTGIIMKGYHFFNVYSILGGLFFIALFANHGALWLSNRLPKSKIKSMETTLRNVYLFLLILGVIFLIASYIKTSLFINYIAHPIASIIILGLLISLLGTGLTIIKKNWSLAFILSSFTVAFVAIFAFAGIYPNLLPSSITAANGLTLMNASSSQLTLAIMLGVALVFVPIVIAYQIWIYYIFRQRIE